MLNISTFFVHHYRRYLAIAGFNGFRNTLVEFLYAVIDKAGSEHIDVSKLINLTLTEYPAIQE